MVGRDHSCLLFIRFQGSLVCSYAFTLADETENSWQILPLPQIAIFIGIALNINNYLGRNWCFYSCKISSENVIFFPFIPIPYLSLLVPQILCPSNTKLHAGTHNTCIFSLSDFGQALSSFRSGIRPSRNLRLTLLQPELSTHPSTPHTYTLGAHKVMCLSLYDLWSLISVTMNLPRTAMSCTGLYFQHLIQPS